MRADRGYLQKTVCSRMTGRTLLALLFAVLAVGCSADRPAVEELRPAVVVKAPPPEPANFQSELLPGAPRVPDAATNPAVRGSYPIGRAGNPVPPGPRVAPRQVPQELPAAPPTTTDTVPPTTTTTATSPPETPTTTSSAPARDAPTASASEGPSTTTTTAPLLETEAIDP